MRGLGLELTLEFLRGIASGGRGGGGGGGGGGRAGDFL